MCEDGELTKVLITVMTYPHPSRKYRESVCTAGITEEGDWVRLYPIDYRYRTREQQFRKYQWIEVELEPRGHGNDNRLESRRPNLESIRLIGDALDSRTDRRWEKRRLLIDRLPHRTVNRWKQLHEQDQVSLGIVRPKRVLDVEIREVESQWKPQWQSMFRQLWLFGPQQKPLRKLPYSFHYVFECEDRHSAGTPASRNCSAMKVAWR